MIRVPLTSYQVTRSVEAIFAERGTHYPVDSVERSVQSDQVVIESLDRFAIVISCRLAARNDFVFMIGLDCDCHLRMVAIGRCQPPVEGSLPVGIEFVESFLFEILTAIVKQAFAEVATTSGFIEAVEQMVFRLPGVWVRLLTEGFGISGRPTVGKGRRPGSRHTRIVVFDRLTVLTAKCTSLPVNFRRPILVASPFDFSALQQWRPPLGRSQKNCRHCF